MTIKLAKTSLDAEAVSIEYKELVEILSEKKVVFLDASTDKSAFTKLKKDFSTLIASEIKFGLAEGEFIYEVHVVE